MKKALLTLIAVVALSNIVVYADHGKKVSKKSANKKEAAKSKCPNRPGCICN